MLLCMSVSLETDLDTLKTMELEIGIEVAIIDGGDKVLAGSDSVIVIETEVCGPEVVNKVSEDVEERLLNGTELERLADELKV